MALFTRYRACTAVFASLLWLASGCTLTASDVEPALPSGPVNGSSTLAYYANGRPVVANNSFSLISILVSFFGDSRAVVGKMYAATASSAPTVEVRAIDDPGTAADVKYRSLRLALASFHGTGTYPLNGPGTSYEEITPYNGAQPSLPGLTYYVAPGAPAQVVVTVWDAATRHLQGTFALTAAAAGVAQPVALTDGRFDLILDP